MWQRKNLDMGMKERDWVVTQEEMVLKTQVRNKEPRSLLSYKMAQLKLI